MEEYRFSIHLCDNQQEIEATQDGLMVTLDGLSRNIIRVLGNVELGKSLRIFIRDEENQVVGGLTADMFGGWVYIALLWVHESLRNQGYGTKLVTMLEEEAIRRGCKYAHVDTFSFEARPFYERLGYELFGTLEDYPQGFCKYFLKKRLVQ
jgi:GNAT superfamily N-acetyltransferase